MNTHPWFSKDVYDLDQSLRFEDGRLAYLSRLPESAGNRRTWTYSSWVKRGNIATSEFPLLAANTDANNRFYFRFEGDVLKVYWNVAGTSNEVVTTAVYRDPSAWYHVVLAVDTTQSTASNRIKIYVNGVQQTLTGTYIPEDTDTQINLNVLQVLGKKDTANTFYDGYLAELHLIDGTALGPNSFGTTGENGGWIPKAYPGAHGTNGFYLPFKADYTVEGFSTVTYRGRNGGQYIGGVGFSPDLLWIKCRNYNEYPFFVDSIRGAGKELKTLNTEAESSNGFVTSFQSDGFVLLDNDGPANRHSDGGTFVAWSWDMGGSNANNTTGSIDTVVRANAAYGHSIVSATYTGSGTKTFGHGLSSAPELIIGKNRTAAANWGVYHSAIGAGKYLLLDTDAAEVASTTIWSNTAPTSTVFSSDIGWLADADQNVIFYCFHSVAGYSKIGSYTGNGSTTGTTVTLGFRPAFVILKPSSAADHWNIYDTTRDTTNPIDTLLFANRNNVEGNGQDIEISDTGFQLKTTNTGSNGDGTTYVYMAFADTREYAYWLDQSGNNNDWQSNNLTESDVMVDSPTNNFATFDPLSMGIAAFGGTLAEGNLRFNGTNGNYHTNARSTIAVQSGKWYAEFYVGTASADSTSVGILGANSLNPPVDGSNLQQSNGSPSFSYESNGDKEVAPLKVTGNNNSTATANWGAAYTSAGAIIAVAIDFDSAADGLIYFYKDNTLQTSTYMANDVSLAHSWHFAIGAYSDDVWIANFGQDSSFAGNKTAQGNQDVNGIGDFYYTPPSGYLALCTSNLPEPTVDPRNHFNTALYTGDGSAQDITTVGFQPDWVWIKNREATDSHQIFDAIRGVTKTMHSDTTGAETTNADTLTHFLSNGFTTGDDVTTNTDGEGYVAWNWKANGTGSSNTNGSINSTVSVNTGAGFSIVSYTGTGSNATVGHGLSLTPEIIIVKNRITTDEPWFVYSRADPTDFLRLNETDATADNAAIWNDTAPTSSVFSIGDNTGINGSSQAHIAYCFRSVDGYSKFGSYTGNGNADGAFIYTGFRPAFVICKDTTGNGWQIIDSTRSPFNVTSERLLANLSNAEQTNNTPYDFTSNGFKLRTTDGSFNTNGTTYIYLAFAETPFKYSNAR